MFGKSGISTNLCFSEIVNSKFSAISLVRGLFSVIGTITFTLSKRRYAVSNIIRPLGNLIYNSTLSSPASRKVPRRSEWIYHTA